MSAGLPRPGSLISDGVLMELARRCDCFLRLYRRATTNMTTPYAAATATAPLTMPAVVPRWELLWPPLVPELLSPLVPKGSLLELPPGVLPLPEPPEPLLPPPPAGAAPR